MTIRVLMEKQKLVWKKIGDQYTVSYNDDPKQILGLFMKQARSFNDQRPSYEVRDIDGIPFKKFNKIVDAKKYIVAFIEDNIKESLLESKKISIKINDGVKKYDKTFKGRSAEMVGFLIKQKGFQQVGFWDKPNDINFEFFFENSKQAIKYVKKMNEIYGYWFKSIGNNGRILEMELNDVGFKEFLGE